jgi:hypothetical protein
MKLPKIDSPIFQIKLISIDKPIKFRPFTVKEEKILLMAEEGKDNLEILTAIKQVINNCCVSDLDIDNLPLFDIEYFFLQLRAKSVNNVSVLKYKDNSDNIIREFEVSLDDIKPTIDPKHSNTVKITDNITVTFKYPSLEMALKLGKLENTTNIEYLAECLDKVFEEEEVYDASNFSLEQKIEFISSFNSKIFEKVVSTFINTMPKLSHKIEYVNAKQEKRVIVLEGFRSFFQ